MEILIADPEIQVREMLSFYLQDNYEPITKIYLAQNIQEATDLFSNHIIDICFCGHQLTGGSGLELINFLKKRNIETRMLILSDQPVSEIEKIYKDEDIFYYFSRADILSSFDQFIKKCESDKVQLTKKQVLASYSPVSLDFLLVLSNLPCDIFIKLSDKKYLKCLSQGDMFLEADKSKYSSKNVDLLYLKFEDDNRKIINQAIATAINKVFTSHTSPFQEKISIVHSQVSGMLKLNGMTPELSEVTRYTVSKSVEMISKIEILNDFWKNINLLGEYPSKLYTLQTILCNLILKELEWNSEATFFKLSLASFLQDVTLTSLNLIKIKDYNEFLQVKGSLTNEEVKSFLDHPFKVKDIVDSIKEIPPDIDKIVLEQHELPKGDGFPRKLNALQMGQLSCIFILTGITSRTLLEQGNKFNPTEFLDSLDKAGYSKGNFRDAFKILKKIFS
jgi:response regulator RpfG family c-di-GMP phosphodiesterase